MKTTQEIYKGAININPEKLRDKGFSIGQSTGVGKVMGMTPDFKMIVVEREHKLYAYEIEFFKDYD